MALDDFAKGEGVQAYIEAYAREHGVDKVTKFQTRVTAVVPEDGGWTVWTDDDSAEKFTAVVFASGYYSQKDKCFPDGLDDLKTSEEQTYVHSVDFRDPTIVKNKNVVVVGYGKSAFDCAEASVDAGAKKTTLLYRSTHWPVPRKILGLVPFEYATFSRLGAALLTPKYYVAGPVENLIHGIPGLISFFWKFVGKIFSFQLGLGDLEPEMPLADDMWCGHGVLPTPKFFSKIKTSIHPLKGNITKVVPEKKAIIVDTKKEIPADVIIFGTGFHADTRLFPAAIQDAIEPDGLWLYRNIVHPDVPSCFFVGSRITTFTNITTASLQARWVALKLKNGLPSKMTMRSDINDVKLWKRRTMPYAGASRASMLQLHQLHYHDQLLKDLNLPIRQKSNILAEIFDPYRPSDYAGVITGALLPLSGGPPDKMSTSPALKREPSFLSQLRLLLLNVLLLIGACVAAFAFVRTCSLV